MRRALTSLALVLAVAAAGCAGPSGPERTEVAQSASPSETTTDPSPSQTTPEPSPSATATEPPPVAAPLLRFAVLGDFGSGLPEQFAVADRMCSWRRGHPFQLVITTGDNIYDEGERRYFDDRFFRPYRCLLNDGVRFRAALGNHDIATNNGRPEIRAPAFGIKRRNYVVRKNGVRFVIWDSNHPNLEWLREKLRPEPGDRWTVVSFHHPVFTPGPHGDTPGFASIMPRLFRRKGVDLVLNGHDHLYAVMPPKRRIRYVVTGGGGAGLYGCEQPERFEICVSRHHFLYVVAGEDGIAVEAVPISGPPFHGFVTGGRD